MTAAPTATGLRLPPLVSADRARDIVRRRAPALRQGDIGLRFHPFAGFVHHVRNPMFGATRGTRAYTLVDRSTGKVFVTDPWPPLERVAEDDACPVAPEHPGLALSMAQARALAARTVSVAALQKFRLARTSVITVTDEHELIWKPNLLLTCHGRSGEIRILVDGLNGNYCVLGE